MVKKAPLVAVHLRLRERDVIEARAIAAVTATPYQHVLRQWIADGADRARKAAS